MADQNPNIGLLIKLLLLRKFGRCIECRSPYVGTLHVNDWAIKRSELEIPAGIKCPECQSDEERFETAALYAERQYLKDPNPDDPQSQPS